MTILKTHTYEDGFTVGFDSEVNDWVPIDKAAFEGSAVGNIGRAAGRGVSEIVQGIKELGPIDPRLAAQGELLRQQQEQAARVAPTAEMLGGAVPDVAAGAGLALGTGGMGLVPMLGAEAGLGGLLGGIRPGTVEERATRAIVGSALSVGGAAVGPVAVKGIGLGLKMFGAIENRALSGVSQAAEAGITRGRAAELASSRQATAVAEPGLTPSPPGSVGAARAEAVPEEFAQESAALAQTEAAGGEISTKAHAEMRRIAEEEGYRSPLGAGTREGSAARKVAAVREMTPFGEMATQQLKHDNQALLSVKVADALGLPEPQMHTSLDLPQMADAEQISKNLFDQVERGLPNVEAKQFAKEMQTVANQKKGPAGKAKGQKIVNDMIDDANKHGGFYDGEEMMDSRRTLQEQMALLYRNGEISSGDTVRDAIAKIDLLLEKRLKQEKLGDTLAKWKQARSQWQILEMVRAPGVRSATGDINAQALLRHMMKKPSNAGFGFDGPERGTAARKIWNQVRIQAADATHIPLTGVRGLIAEQMKGTVGKSLVGGAGGLLGINALGGLFD